MPMNTDYDPDQRDRMHHMQALFWAIESATSETYEIECERGGTARGISADIANQVRYLAELGVWISGISIKFDDKSSLGGKSNAGA